MLEVSNVPLDLVYPVAWRMIYWRFMSESKLCTDSRQLDETFKTRLNIIIQAQFSLSSSHYQNLLKAVSHYILISESTKNIYYFVTPNRPPH